MSELTTEFRADRLTKLLEHLETHPEQHNQSGWGIKDTECGTVACAAGWSVLLFRPGFAEEFAWSRWPTLVGFAYHDKGGVRIPDLAAETLGLTSDQAEALFYRAENLDEVRYVIEALVESDGEVDGRDLCDEL